MGNVCCGTGNFEMLQRVELLKEGGTFKRKVTYLGVLSKTDTVFLQLNAAATRANGNRKSSVKLEEVPICRIGKVCAQDTCELLILSLNGQKLLELTADSPSLRDLWVQTLEELSQSVATKGSDADSQALKEELNKQSEKQKEKYWKERTADLERRKVEAEERKKKFGNVGMKYTAEAMAKR
ncbi:TPA: hypothetical protein N0F65_006966 [Lagenidium giganteum]|uniref:PH domain-containing protein n=1 Tax=Lagenidium giganteum TaxID=4803 RepID=A0AAV2ZKC0_9STRA|nr:TPA: hypothetical protein N0F65_006966 [Lagenidium giganteum]